VLLVFLAVFFWTSAQAAQQAGVGSSQPATPAASPGKIGASAVWQPPQDFIGNAHLACDKSAGPASPAQCFINQMSAAGAPPDAVSFTRMLFEQSDGQFGIMSAFQKFGPVDAAQVLFPLRANDNYGLLLVNGDPKILDVDDLKKLDRATMDKSPMYTAVKNKFPQADLWPGDRSGNMPWPKAEPLPDGGTRFIVTYLLINGCHACRRLGLARFGWDFDASGKFLRADYVATPPPPKLRRPGPPGQPADAPPPPAAPPQQNP
jgi:hypothetical protein